MNRIVVVFVLLALLISSPVWSQMPGKLYLGGSVGSSFIETKPTAIGNEDLKIDKNGFAYKIFAGYKSPKLIGIEADYRNLGTVKDKLLGTEFKSNVKGFDIFVTGTLSFAFLEVFAKAGYFFWSSELKGGNISQKADDGDFVWGVGAGLGLGKLGVRAEWEMFNVGDLESLSMLSAGITYNIL